MNGETRYISRLFQITCVLSGFSCCKSALNKAFEMMHRLFLLEKISVYFNGKTVITWINSDGMETFKYYTGPNMPENTSEGYVDGTHTLFIDGTPFIFQFSHNGNKSEWLENDIAELESIAVYICTIISKYMHIVCLDQDMDSFYKHFADSGRGKGRINQHTPKVIESKFDENTDDSLTRFLPYLCHEMRTPLHSIAGFLALLKPYINGLVATRYMDEIEGCAYALAVETTAVFDILEPTYSIKNNLDFDIKSLFVQVLRYNVPLAYRNNSTFHSFISPEIPQIIHGDVAKIGWAFVHIFNYMMNNHLAENNIFDFSVSVKERVGNTVTLSIVFRAMKSPPLSLDVGGRYFAGLAAACRHIETAGGSIDFDSSNGSLMIDVTMKFEVIKDLPLEEQNLRYVSATDYSGLVTPMRRFLKSISCSVVPVGLEEYFKPEARFYAIDDLNERTAKIVTDYESMSVKDNILIKTFNVDFGVVDKIKMADIKILLEPISVKGYDSLDEILADKAQSESLEQELHFYGKILVAEDNPLNGKMITLLLEKYGLDVTLVTNGLQAVQAFKEGFDLILMDISMPVMDGITATKSMIEIARENMVKLPPILALTANMPSDYKAYIDAGMHGVIPKPVTMDSLKDYLRHYLVS